MLFFELLLSKKTIVSILILLVLSLALIFFPLVGLLGYEYSVIISFLLAFVCIFTSTENMDISYIKRFQRRRLSDLLSSIYLVNLVLLAVPFLIGFTKSYFKNDCNIKDGIFFYLLIPTVTMFFATSLGCLVGYLFPRRGFLIGSFVLIISVAYSLWSLYWSPSIFFYNSIIGYFPGPIYDEIIPITRTLILYRVIILLWGFALLLTLTVIYSLRSGKLSLSAFVILIFVVPLLIIPYYKKDRIGFSITRDYIKKHYLTQKIETDNFIIFYPPDTKAARHIDFIAKDHEWRYKQLQSFLQVDLDEKIISYIYPDNDTRKKLVGAGETTIANPIHKEIHLIYDSYPNPILKHELTHVMSSEFGSNLLKISPKFGLVEGLAVAADWNSRFYGGLDRHQWSKSLIKSDLAPDVKDIIGTGFLYYPANRSYTIMGSFSRFLIDVYGIDKFKEFYRSGNESVYKKDIGNLVLEWKSFLKTVELPSDANKMTEAKFSDLGIFMTKCPRRTAELKKRGFEAYSDGNYCQAEEFFKKALLLNSGDTVALISLAYSYYFDKNYDKVLELQINQEFLPDIDRKILENLKGDVYWQLDDVVNAELIFDEIHDETIPDDIKRQIDIKLSALNSIRHIESKIREYFSTRNNVLKITLLEEIINDFPYYSPPYYLTGRLLFDDGYYSTAIPYLYEADELGLPSSDLTIENLRLLGISYFAEGKYENSINVFNRLLLLDSKGTNSEYFSDMLDMSSWTLVNHD